MPIPKAASAPRQSRSSRRRSGWPPERGNVQGWFRGSFSFNQLPLASTAVLLPIAIDATELVPDMLKIEESREQDGLAA